MKSFKRKSNDNKNLILKMYDFCILYHSWCFLKKIQGVKGLNLLCTLQETRLFDENAQESRSSSKKVIFLLL